MRQRDEQGRCVKEPSTGWWGVVATIIFAACCLFLAGLTGFAWGQHNATPEVIQLPAPPPRVVKVLVDNTKELEALNTANGQLCEQVHALQRELRVAERGWRQSYHAYEIECNSAAINYKGWERCFKSCPCWSKP